MEHNHNKRNKLESKSVASTFVNKTVQNKAIELQDNRPTTIVQKKANNTGLPDNLKSGIENLSGHAMDDVKVHYNSNKPAQLNAHAYAQGSEIHLASGQEKHLPHEAWHVVQQKQGRVKPTMQMKGKVNINDDKGLETEADIMGASALQRKSSDESLENNLISTATTTTNPFQLQKVTELTSGVLNMIGETHTDYPNKEARRYEAKEVRTVLGEQYQYYTEGKLKVKDNDKDYADPVDQRLEQSIAFIKEEGKTIIDNLKGIDKEKLESGIKKSTIIKKQVKKQKDEIDIEPVIQEFAPKIADKDFNLEKITEELGISDGKYSLEMTQKLSEIDNWQLDTYDPEGTYYDNFYEITALFLKEFYRLEDEKEEKEKPDDDVSEDEELDLENIELIKTKNYSYDVIGFYDKFKGRLPQSLKLYYSLSKSGHYDKAHFKFDLKMVPDALEKWDKIEKLSKLTELVMSKDKEELLSDVVDAAINKLEALILSLGKGVKIGLENVSVMSAKEKRSIAMNNAAEQLKNKPIVWKVGNLHIEDIIRLEANNTIPPNNYAYMTKDDFKGKYIDESNMKSHKGNDNDLGDGYIKADLAFKEALKKADKQLNERLPWEDQIDTIEHLDLSNLITNQTRVIVEAVENGALPKLKSLIILKQSMTPELLKRLKSKGVSVTLK